MSNFWEKEVNLSVINPEYEIGYIAEKMLEQAQDENCLVSGVLRGIKLTAAPNMKSPDDIKKQYERKVAKKPIAGKCPFYPAMILGDGAVKSLREGVRDCVISNEDFIRSVIFVSLTADKVTDSSIVCAAFNRKNSSCIAKNSLVYGICEELRKELYKNNICHKLLAR